MTPLSAQIERTLAALPPDVEVGLWVRRNGVEELARDSDWCCPTASIGKVFLLIEAARAIRADQVSPDELLRRAEFDLVVTPDYGNTSRLRPSLCPMSRGWSAV